MSTSWYLGTKKNLVPRRALAWYEGDASARISTCHKKFRLSKLSDPNFSTSFFPFHFSRIKTYKNQCPEASDICLKLAAILNFFIHKLFKRPKFSSFFLNRLLPSAPMANGKDFYFWIDERDSFIFLVMLGMRFMWSSTHLVTQVSSCRFTWSSLLPASIESLALSLQCMVHRARRSCGKKDSREG